MNYFGIIESSLLALLRNTKRSARPVLGITIGIGGYAVGDDHVDRGIW